MREEDWRLIAYIGVVLGIIFVLGAAIAYVWQESFYGLFYTYPYRNYMPGLLIGGAALFIIGMGALWRAGLEKKKRVGLAWLAEIERQKRQIPPPPRSAEQAPSPRRHCEFCGAEIDEEIFCPRCGKVAPS